jgi:FkbM family methyltransferase
MIPTEPIRISLPDGPSYVVCGSELDPLMQHFRALATIPEDCPVPLARALVRPGQVVLDIGAHIGFFSLAMASLGCRVVAVEANPENVRYLQASIALNGFADRIQVINAVASDHFGKLPFFSHGATSRVCVAGARPDLIEVAAEPLAPLLDRSGVRQIDLIKIDIEGHEIEALQGAADWLSGPAAPPIIYESNHFAHHLRGRSALRLRQFIASLGYQGQYRSQPASRVLLDVGPDDFHAEMYVDYLATRKPLRGLDGWEIAPGPDLATIAKELLQTFGGAFDWALAAYGTSLSAARRQMLRHPGIRCYLDDLRLHASEEVRDSVRWYTPPSGILGAIAHAWMARWRKRHTPRRAA